MSDTERRRTATPGRRSHPFIEVIDDVYSTPARVRAIARCVGLEAGANREEPCQSRIDRPAFAEPVARAARIIGAHPGILPTDSDLLIMRDGRPIAADSPSEVLIVVCLAPEGTSPGGIAFYRPTATPTAGAWGSEGLHAVRHPVGLEETMYVPMRSNRMIVFSSSFEERRAVADEHQSAGWPSLVVHLNRSRSNGEPSD